MQGQNFGKYVNASACSGTLVINVTSAVTKDADSGFAGYWAYDNYRKQVQVWQTAPGSFCVLARYEGQFTTVAGSSPAGTSTVAAGHTGTMTGGYQYTFDGVLNPSPAYAATVFVHRRRRPRRRGLPDVALRTSTSLRGDIMLG